MHVIAKTPLLACSDKHPDARDKLLSWYKTMKSCNAKDFNELKKTFNSADYVPKKFTVFDIGNEYRIVAVIYYDTQKVYLRLVGTHHEYDKWTKENRGK